jgi:hypothetical protein
LARQRHKTAAHEILERILPIDGRQTRDRPAAARHNDLGAVLNPLEVLAQAVVQLPNPDLVASIM